MGCYSSVMESVNKDRNQDKLPVSRPEVPIIPEELPVVTTEMLDLQWNTVKSRLESILADPEWGKYALGLPNPLYEGTKKQLQLWLQERVPFFNFIHTSLGLHLRMSRTDDKF